MKNKRSTALLLAILMIASVFLNTTAVFAEGEPEVPELNQPIEKVEVEEVKDKKDALEEEKSEEAGLEISGEKVPEAVGEPATEKTFTVTKRLVGSTEDGELVGNYDTFYDAMGNCKQEDLSNEYVVTMNSDYTIPETEAMWGKSEVNILLKSKEENQFTLKRPNKDFITLFQGVTLKIENVIIDGSANAKAIGVMGGTLTLGKGAVVQNCTEYPNFDGPAIFVSSNGVLNIEEGAIIQNNNSDKAGGAIQARNDSTVNISGGTFKNNHSNKSDGGAIAAYGTINITGGTFEGNEAKKTGGAILIGSRATASISGAIFKGNKGRTSGAIYSSKEFSVSNTTFENNEAVWGGAIFASKKLTLSESTFKENTTTSAGGALYLQGGADIKDSNFTSNSTVYSGGAIFTSQGVELNNVSFNENIANKQGGAVYLKSGNTGVINSSFTNNSSGTGGGAIFINHNNNGTTKVSNSIFTENTSNAFGGGIYLGLNGKLEVSRSEFTKNQAAYGAGIASAAYGNIDVDLTNIKVEGTSFVENEALEGGGIFTAFPTEITNSTFTKNKALVHPQDDQTNPHDSGVGGAIRVMDNKTTIKGSTYEENWAFGSGGAIGINGLIRDDNLKITGIKPNIKVEISDGTKFISNICNVGQGGAIYTIPYLYDIENQETDVDKDILKANAYKNLTTAADTVFKDNVALSGFFTPPANYDKYTNLDFDRNSFKDVLPDKDLAKSLLNNYDVNFINVKVKAYFDPNDGEFKEGKNPKDIRVVKGEKDKEITLLDAPKRDGYKFTGWKCSMNIPEEILKELDKKIVDQLKGGKIFKAGDKFILDADYIFLAQWEKEEPQPEPKPQENIFTPFFFSTPTLNKEDHYQYLIGYSDDTFRPENNMTREEVAVMFSRLLKNQPAKGAVYNYNFNDVEKDRWSITAISYMSEMEIIKGYPDGSFRPQTSITRAEFASIATKFAELTEGNKTFNDLTKDHWAYDLVSRAATAGWINGYPDGSFKPDNKITRAEVVSITNLMLNRKADEEYIDNNLDKLLKYKDVTKNHWAYYKIFEATNGHDFVRDRNKIDEEWKDITNKSFVYDK